MKKRLRALTRSSAKWTSSPNSERASRRKNPMKYLDEYRDGRLAATLVGEIRRTVTRPWTLMEVFGGQTHPIVKYGLDELLPAEVELVHGPGCPVCVTPLEMLDRAHAIARRPGVIFCSFGDMLRVPGSNGDLFQIKAEGGDVRIVYSPLDSLKLARAHPDKQVVFFGIGFETTAPANAMSVWQARAQGLANFSLLVSHVLVPPAIRDPRIAVESRARFPGARTRLRRHGLDRIRAAGGALSRADSDHRLRAARSAGRYPDGGSPTGRRPRYGGESVRARGHPRRQCGGAQNDRAGLRGVRPRLARYRRHPAKRLPPARRVPRTRRRAGLRCRQRADRGASRLYQRPGLAGPQETARMSRLWDPVHARNPARGHHGLRRRRLRGLLQLSWRGRACPRRYGCDRRLNPHARRLRAHLPPSDRPSQNDRHGPRQRRPPDRPTGPRPLPSRLRQPIPAQTRRPGGAGPRWRPHRFHHRLVRGHPAVLPRW